jgi:urease accessory protein
MPAPPRTPVMTTATITDPGTEPEATGRAAQGTALYRLLAWVSPAFPTGAFSYSHGLEAAVAAGAICDRGTLQDWVAAIVISGSGRMDADIVREAYRAARADDEAALAEANRRGLAYRATAELALESAQQGEAFAATVRAAWAAPHPNPLPASGERERAAALPLARQRMRSCRCHGRSISG